MRSVPAPAFLRVLRLLLPLVACGWGSVVANLMWSTPDELVHLYTSSNMKDVFLAISSDGQVYPASSKNVDSAVFIKPVSAADVSIIGGNSKRYLCMYSNGELFGSISYNAEECVFRHTLLENAYDVYQSTRYNFLVSLGKNKRPLVPNQNLPRFSQFLTLRN